jgi:two-component system, chemotaxis family, sensor kinase CheA
LAHVGENLLSRLREGELVLNPTIASALLKMVDAVRQILGSIESDKNQGNVDYSSLIEVLSKLTKGESVDEVPGASPAFEENPPEQKEAKAETSVVPAEEQSAAPVESAEPSEKKPERRQEGRASVSESSIRVDVGLLDKLMNLVGELVLARNQIMQHSISNDDAKDSAFAASSQHLNLITTELQEGVMKTRCSRLGTFGVSSRELLEILLLLVIKKFESIWKEKKRNLIRLLLRLSKIR